MGLDWMLYGRPAPGREKEFARLTATINRLEEERCGEKEKKLLDRTARRRDKICVSPWEEVGCPMIGRDAEADEWLRQRHRERRADPDDEWADLSFEEVLEECRGIYVEDLAREPEGIALIQGPLAGALNFRGRVISDAEAIVGEDLAEEAYHNHTADECLDFAARLDQVIGEHLGAGSASPPPIDEPELFALLAAVQWLRFWGSRGFGYDAWY
jgi:hypothetical protein